MDILQDKRIRTAAFVWLAEQVALHGDVLPRDLLATGFIINGNRVPLLGPQGIFKPKVLSQFPLSITTSPGGPYDDAFGEDGLLQYRYRGTNPEHRDNQGLRLAMQYRIPLVYFHGLVPGKYLAAWPAYIVGDDPKKLAVTVAVDDERHLSFDGDKAARVPSEYVQEAADDARRSYVTSSVRVRLHQRAFRERVLEAYQRQCAFCRFRHEEMLEAAHIIPDSHPEGEPVVRNGIALCTLHHSAFDRRFIGIRPDYKIEVRPDILREHDGPTLVHAIQALHGQSILIPKKVAFRPDQTLLAMRYDLFRAMF
jgi:putative restriction endonuclease